MAVNRSLCISGRGGPCHSPGICGVLRACMDRPQATQPPEAEETVCLGFDVTIDGQAAIELRALLGDEFDTSPVRLQWGTKGHGGPGLYASHPDYPEEGAVLLAAVPSEVMEMAVEDDLLERQPAAPALVPEAWLYQNPKLAPSVWLELERLTIPFPDSVETPLVSGIEASTQYQLLDDYVGELRGLCKRQARELAQLRAENEELRARPSPLDP